MLPCADLRGEMALLQCAHSKTARTKTHLVASGCMSRDRGTLCAQLGLFSYGLVGMGSGEMVVVVVEEEKEALSRATI